MWSILILAGLFVSNFEMQTGTSGGAYDSDSNLASTFRTMRFVMEDGSGVPLELAVFASGNCVIANTFGSGTVEFRARGGPCVVSASAIGLRSWRGNLKDQATIVLKRLGEHEGSNVSITVLKAPASARKAYGKGAQEMLKKKYAEAIKHFELAVKEYPAYALAWSEMARAQVELGRVKEARIAIAAAVKADSKYIKPLVQLAALEAADKNWLACGEAADAAIALNAIEFPGAYLYRAQAHQQEGDWKTAARLFSKAIQLDPLLEFPSARLMLAEMLAKRRDWRTAQYVLDQFLEARPEAEQIRLAKELREQIKALPMQTQPK